MRLARRVARILALTLVVIVGVSAVAVGMTQTGWFKNWLRGYIVREAGQYLNGQLSIQRLGGNLFFGIELENIVLSLDGAPVVTIKDLNAGAVAAKGMTDNEAWRSERPGQFECPRADMVDRIKAIVGLK